jgi:hypothetical protein
MIKLKTILVVGGIALVLGLIPSGILFYKLAKLESQNQQLSGQLDVRHKMLTDSLQRAETNRVSREELEDFAVESRLQIQKVRADLNSLGADLRAIASTKAGTTTVVHKHYPSDVSTPSGSEVPICEEDGRPIDVHGYTKRVETRHLEDSNGMRVADVSFEAAEEDPWTSRVHAIQYTINNAIGQNRDGTFILHTELLAESEAQPGETFRIDGVESRMLQIPEEVNFEWWDPALMLSVALGIAVHPDIDLAASLALQGMIMSYGDWRFIGISVGFDAWNRSFFASFIPFMYNVGSPIPVLSDLWLGAYVGIDHRTNVSVGLVVGTRL